MNLTDYTTRFPLAKKLTKPQTNLLFALDDMGVQLFVTDNVFCRNPITGFSATINPLLARLIEWTYEVYASYDPMAGNPMNYRGKKVSVAVYDRVRYLVLAIDSSVYRDFLD